MIYLDTSFLTPLFRSEPESARVEKVLTAQAPGTLAVSHWTRVEFASVIARDVRMKVLTEKQARQLLEAFDALLEDALHVLIPSAADFDLARDFVAEFATQLRGPDALHLAIARNQSIEMLFTLDEGLTFAAKKLRIKAGAGID